MSATTESRVTLKSKDNQLFDVGYEVIRECKLLQTAFEFTSVSSEPVLVCVESSYLKVAIDFLTLFKDEPMYEPPIDSQHCPEVPDDAPGIVILQSHSNEFIMEMINAAEYLDCSRLRDYVCHVIWKRAKGKSIDQMAAFFNMTDRFTPAELAKLDKDNQFD